MKIALVHDFLIEYGGAERVLEALHEIWPEAPIYTALYDWKKMGAMSQRFKNWEIRPSWVQHCWLVKKLHSPLRFLSPLIWGSLDLSQFDVVITSSGWFICRGVKTGSNTLHISYLHHPPRHLYGYPTKRRWEKYLLTRIYGNVINHFLRLYDFQTAQKVDYFIANSKTTAARIRKFYRREAKVIYPPVELPKAYDKMERSSDFGDSYFLTGGRLDWAKRIDLVIKACTKLKRPLKIYGKGREEEKLRAMAGPTIEFVGHVSDEELAQLYSGCQAFIFTALDEDFGIVPVEAMSFGKPVIALRQGGVVESIIEGKTGEFFDEPTVESLVKVLKKFKPEKYKPEDCRKQAQKFSKERFKREIRRFVARKIASQSRA